MRNEKIKKLRRTFGICILAITMVGSSVAVFADTGNAKASDTKSTATITKSSSSLITRNKAKEMVNNRLTGETLKYMRDGYDDGIRVYKGKVVKGNYVYSFEINRTTGKFMEWEKDYEGSTSTASRIGSSFTMSEAKAKVRNRVKNIIIIYVRLVRDDGRWVYEGEGYKNGSGYEYNFEMNAYSGNWIEWERDSVFD